MPNEKELKFKINPEQIANLKQELQKYYLHTANHKHNNYFTPKPKIDFEDLAKDLAPFFNQSVNPVKDFSTKASVRTRLVEIIDPKDNSINIFAVLVFKDGKDGVNGQERTEFELDFDPKYFDKIEAVLLKHCTIDSKWSRVRDEYYLPENGIKLALDENIGILGATGYGWLVEMELDNNHPNYELENWPDFLISFASTLGLELLTDKELKSMYNKYKTEQQKQLTV